MTKDNNGTQFTDEELVELRKAVMETFRRAGLNAVLVKHMEPSQVVKEAIKHGVLADRADVTLIDAASGYSEDQIAEMRKEVAAAYYADGLDASLVEQMPPAVLVRKALFYRALKKAANSAEGEA